MEEAYGGVALLSSWEEQAVDTGERVVFPHPTEEGFSEKFAKALQEFDFW